jgi:hypothetical protein
MAGPMQTCRSCGAEIIWIRSEKGRACICDAKPVSGMTADGKVTRVWISHFATCPNAAAHRKPKTEEEAPDVS